MADTQGYKTKQRELILHYLTENKDTHVTAEDVAQHLRKQGTSVGKSTVYRYLDKLVAQGMVRKFVVEEGTSACYQYSGSSDVCHQHYHLKCFDCGKLMHVECSWLSEVSEHVLSHHNFKIDNSKTVLYGQCAACAARH